MMFDAGRGCSHDVDQHDPPPTITYLFKLPTFCFGQNRPPSWIAFIRTQDILCYGSFQVYKNRTTVVGWNLRTSSLSPGFLMIRTKPTVFECE
jgi:hypothetical protein